jgi:hypothetical protein
VDHQETRVVPVAVVVLQAIGRLTTKGVELVESSADLHTWTVEFESAVSAHLV